jgi:curved DNA-binding protein CbpA
MNDCFALLNEPRRPWLDPEALKNKFLSLSSTFHPDRVHNASHLDKNTAQQRYSEINTAYNRLRDPKERLLHFLELELGHRPTDTQRITPELADFFNQMHSLCSEADALLREKQMVSSPMLKVAIFERGQATTEKLFELQHRINSNYENVMAEIKVIDAEWEQTSDRDSILTKLQTLYRLLSYFTRWSGQIQERIVQLSL